MKAFDSVAEEYDRWYEEPEGRAVFAAELECLRTLVGWAAGDWLEVGVGTGRFAQGLGIGIGIDPSPRMLKIAAERGIRTIEGTAEELPLPAESFDGVLMALTLCFIAHAQEAFAECVRVLRFGGTLLVGMVPSDSPWGREYDKQAAQGHSIYALAYFRTTEEITRLAVQAGLKPTGACSTLFWKPGETPDSMPRTQVGIIQEAGFVGLQFEKKQADSAVP
jgi:ubiquinone/menaquinone biosynthesis C-methylase UbiE